MGGFATVFRCKDLKDPSGLREVRFSEEFVTALVLVSTGDISTHAKLAAFSSKHALE